MELLTDEQRALFVGGGCLADYDVIKPIGKGKFSVVYKAQRRRDGVSVALKKIAIFDLMDARAREKTLKEVRLVQSVTHEHIIQYLDAFLDGKELHIAFEWADAGDLKRQIRKAAERQTRLDERTIWRYFSQICGAIRYLHTARIMHRDLKPANIFLTTQGMVKVGDLGLGRHLSENTLEARSKVGTPLYMSPEVLRGEGYDWKSDVWSLGCILYELAMLRSPFKSEGLNLYGLFQKINKGDFEALPDVYSDHLRTLATRMISLDPAQRPTMDEVWASCQTRPSTAQLAQPPSRPSSNQSQKETAQTTDKSDVQSPASRPVSHQSDATPRSARQSKQPPATAEHQAATASSVTDEELAQRHEDAVMELLYDRLCLLGATSKPSLVRRLTRHHFSTACRSLPQWTRSSQEQFDEMVRVAQWLLVLCSGPEIDTNQPPTVQAQMLLLAAERVGVAATELASISSASLTSGAGLAVGTLLSALSVKALEATRVDRKLPVYTTEAVDEMDADTQWEVQSDDHSSSDSTASTLLTGEGDQSDDGDGDGWVDPQWLVVRESTPASNDDATMIHTCVDAVAWAREVERVGGRLAQQWTQSQATARSSSAALWMQRLEMLHQHGSAMASVRRETAEPLLAVGETARQALTRLSTLEERVAHEPAVRVRREYEAAAIRLRQLTEVARQRQAAVDTYAATRAAAETARQSVQQEVDELQGRVTDTSPLLQLRTQLKRVQLESDAMQVQADVLNAHLWRQRIRHAASR